MAQLLHRMVSDMAAERIRGAITKSVQKNAPDGERRIKAIVDPYAPTGSTFAINFSTTAPLYVHPSQWQTEKRLRMETQPGKCHINLAVCDSSWGTRNSAKSWNHTRKVISYVKNQGLGLEVPYRMQNSSRSIYP